MERLEDCISFLLGKAMQQVSRQAKAKLAPFGVSPLQYAVLKALWLKDGRSGADLGSALRLDSASITGVTDRLEALGLVQRDGDADDRRVNRLYLTSRGKALEGPLDKAMDQLNDEIGAALGSGYTALRSNLRRLGQIEN